ncbi:helix-turn-helix transcriptional regulator [Candidatus Peregrinibacteria bacterium]|nr:helix-turn-helix transcriptional regulator [Candidatus Peregrinibacteria bacterium]
MDCSARRVRRAPRPSGRRAQKGYSLERVARLADLSLNTVIRIESGVNKNPTIETLTKLARALEVRVDDLLK